MSSVQEPGAAGAMPRSSYDAIAGFYDEDMGRNVTAQDVRFYVEQCRGATGWILELGCGTGRVTLPLVAAGARVVGIDASPAMLSVLRAKALRTLSPAERARLHTAAIDMRELPLLADFDAVLCPYSAFTYLLSEHDRRQAL